MAQAYRPTCPSCGKTLEPVALGPETAPWVCHECHLGFWCAELTKEARPLYRTAFRDFGFGGRVRQAVKEEAQEARVRGVSLRPDQVALVPDHVARSLVQSRRVSAEFADHVTQVHGG